MQLPVSLSTQISAPSCAKQDLKSRGKKHNGNMVFCHTASLWYPTVGQPRTGIRSKQKFSTTVETVLEPLEAVGIRREETVRTIKCAVLPSFSSPPTSCRSLPFPSHQTPPFPCGHQPRSDEYMHVHRCVCVCKYEGRERERKEGTASLSNHQNSHFLILRKLWLKPH